MMFVFTFSACDTKESSKPTSVLYVYAGTNEIVFGDFYMYTTKLYGAYAVPMRVVLKDLDGNDITDGKTVIWESSNPNILYFSSAEGNPSYLRSTATEGKAKITVTCGGVKNTFYGITQHDIGAI